MSEMLLNTGIVLAVLQLLLAIMPVLITIGKL